MSPFIILPYSIPSYSQQVLADSPYAYYRFEETGAAVTAVDSSGNGRDGLYQSSPNLNAAGLLTEGGTAMGVVPASDPNMQGMQRGAFTWTADLTIEAWINIDPSVSGSTNMTIAEQYPPAGNGGFLFFVQQDAGPSNRRLTLDIKRTSGVFRTRGATNLTPGVTYHVVGKVNYPTATLWVNGIQETYVLQQTMTTTTFNTDNFNIGYTFWSGGSQLVPFHGVIDEVAFYDYALTPTRILDHYNAG